MPASGPPRHSEPPRRDRQAKTSHSRLLNGAFGSRTGPPGPVLSRFWPEALRPVQFGTGFWSVRTSFTPNTGQKRPRKPSPRTGSTNEQPKVYALVTSTAQTCQAFGHEIQKHNDFRSLGGSRPPNPPGWGLNPPRGVWGAAAPQPGGSGGRELPRERKAILKTGQRPATQKTVIS